MFERLKEKYRKERFLAMLKKGILEGKVMPIEDSVYEQLSHFYFNGIPLNIRLLYLYPLVEPGQCRERSLMLSLGITDANIIGAYMKDLEEEGDVQGSWHYFVEKGDYVYDPTQLMKIDKLLYYQMRRPKIFSIETKSEIENIAFIQDIKSVTLEDLNTSLKERMKLLETIPLLQEIITTRKNTELQTLFEKHIKDTHYNPIEIQKEMQSHLV